MNSVIELPVSEWKAALTGLGKIISKRTTLPVIGHLRVTRDPQGVVTLQATDLDVTARYQADAPNAGSPCDFLVPFAPLNQLVKGGKESLQLVSEGEGRVRLKTFIGTSPLEQQFTAPPVDEYPPAPVMDGKVIPVDATFRDTLRQALDCCGTDSSRHVLHHVCVDTRHKEGHYLAATDGRHLFCANSFQFDLKAPVLIRDQPFLHWNKFMEDGIGELRVKPAGKTSGPFVQLQSGRWTFLSKSGEGEFPNWKQVIPAPSNHRTRIKLDSSAVATLLAGVPRLPGGDDINRPVQIEVADTVLSVKAKAKDAEEWTQLIIDGARIVGPSVSIRLNRELLLKALRFGLTTVEIEDELSVLEFSEGGRRMVVSPLRPPEPPVVPQSEAPAAPPVSDPNPTHPNPPASAATQPAQAKANPTMPKASETNPTTTPLEPSPVKAVMLHIENLKDTLKGALREFSDVLDGLKQLEKEKKASDKEMDSVREKLREIQNVRI